MVSLLLHRRHGRHERGTALPPPALPARFRPLLAHAEKLARGEWTDPALEDWFTSLRREYERWQLEQRIG